ncbi:DUF6519 domain-containing protein [Paraburkholderia fungorum]|uniref:DUF6519 domain-containing protein n=1 Tax=Paraburkholderia fungorum TaxID=134537 RepID=UPI0038B93D6A
MSFDCSRFPFDHWKDYAGVVMQQGRVQLDSDWNEWLAILMRRLQAGTMDTLGAADNRAVYPSTTPYAFQIGVNTGVNPNTITIGYGRIYVDGLLVENHPTFPAQPWTWDPGLAELSASLQPPPAPKPAPPALALADQPYVPVMPALPAAGSALFYLDVWQRPVTWLEDRDLIEIAVGVDTTARLQTVWQVKWLPVDANATCGSDIPDYDAATQPSGARLSSDVVPSPASGPCCLAPNTGYTGMENQLYRVELHQGGPFNKDPSVASVNGPSFKWSRDNASVITAVTAIGPMLLTVESIGRDDVLCFKPNDWIEVTDDVREMAGRTGDLLRIAVDGVDKVNRTIKLTWAVSNDLIDNLNKAPATYPDCHTRVCRWDQAGKVRRSDDNSVWFDLDGLASRGDIPVPGPGVSLILENGVTVSFDLAPATASFSPGDFWTFAARAADGQVEKLKAAPPMGPHHHYARLALVPLPAGPAMDCRVAWPPTASGGADCNCDVCIESATFRSSADLVAVVEKLSASGGGRVCFGPGLFVLDRTVQLKGIANVTLCGHGPSTRLVYEGTGAAIVVEQCLQLRIHDLAIEASLPVAQAGAVGAEVEEPLVALLLGNCAGVVVERCGISALQPGAGEPAGGAGAPPAGADITGNSRFFDARGAANGKIDKLPAPAIQAGFATASTTALAQLRSIAVALSGFEIDVAVRNNTLIADIGIGKLEALASLAGWATLSVEQNPWLVLEGFTARENFIACAVAGIALGEWTDKTGACFHLLETALENNFVLAGFIGIYVEGLTYPGATVRLDANQVETGAYGILSRLDAAAVTDNTVTQLDLRLLTSGAAAATTGAGIVIFDTAAYTTPLYDVRVLRNRIVGVAGPGIVFDAHAVTLTIADNTIQGVTGAGITIGDTAFAGDLVVRGNDILQVAGPALPNGPGVYGIGVWASLNATVRDNVVGTIDVAADTARHATGIVLFNVGNASVGNNQTSDIGTAATTPIACGIVAAAVQFDLNLSANVIRATTGASADAGAFVGLMTVVTEPKSVPVSLQDNHVEGVSSNPLVIVGGTSECVFSANRCRLSGSGKFDFLKKIGGVVYIGATTAVVGNNRIQGPATVTGLCIDVTEISSDKNGMLAMTVLGNIVSETIALGTQIPIKPLPQPWNGLNVIVKGT